MSAQQEITEVRDIPPQHKPVVVTIYNDTTPIADAIDELRDVIRPVEFEELRAQIAELQTTVNALAAAVAKLEA